MAHLQKLVAILLPLGIVFALVVYSNDPESVWAFVVVAAGVCIALVCVIAGIVTLLRMCFKCLTAQKGDSHVRLGNRTRHNHTCRVDRVHLISQRRFYARFH